MERCRAKSKRTGEQCKNWPIKGVSSCKFHGGKSAGAKTKEGRFRQKMASWKHGYYSKEAIEERRQFRDMINEYREEVG